ncbi:MAG: hypothetical protein AB8I69_03670 [Anaerolineae bacterium]|jgi:hypothetical protein
MQRTPALTITTVLMLLTAIGTILFWVIFFADLDTQRESIFALRSETWFAWELSFPLADGWVTLTTLLGAIGLWRSRPTGLLFGLVSGGAMVFLGLIDILFFLENRLYLPVNVEVAVELFIHLWMTSFGLFVIAIIWKHRNAIPLSRKDS